MRYRTLDRVFIWDEYPLLFVGRHRVLYELTGAIGAPLITAFSRSFQGVITLETQERTDAEAIHG
jgi:hypothetical protein